MVSLKKKNLNVLSELKDEIKQARAHSTKKNRLFFKIKVDSYKIAKLTKEIQLFGEILLIIPP
jgi:hypothetical protein